jgi:hypothetical protein
MGIEKLTLTKSKKKTLFGRLTNKFLSHQQAPCSKRDQSVQTSLNLSQTSLSSQLTTTVIVNSRSRQRTCSPNHSTEHNSTIHTPHRSRRQRRRSSLKNFLISHSPKPIPLIHRTRRRSVDLKSAKRMSSECLVSINKTNFMRLVHQCVSLIVFLFVIVASRIDTKNSASTSIRITIGNIIAYIESNISNTTTAIFLFASFHVR